MGPAGPHCRHEIASVRALAEIAVLHTFFIYVIAVLNLDARVDDRDEPDVFVLHLLHKIRKISAEAFPQGEVLVGIHIVNIHIDHIQRDMVFSVSCCDPAEILLRLVSPPALSKAERKLRRDVAAADDTAELPDDIIGRIAVDDIQVQVCALAENLQSIHSRIADVKGQRGRIVKKQAERLFPCKHDKIVGGVE